MDNYQKRDLTGINEILKDLTESTALGKTLEQAKIWDQWETLVGPGLAAHGRPHSVRDKQLRVEVDSAVWMHKFSYRKWEIIKRINRAARTKLIDDLFMILMESDKDKGE